MINIDKLEYKRIQGLVQDALDDPDNPQKAQDAIEAIAKYYGIKIAPGDKWLFMDWLGNIYSSVYGYTPPESGSPYTDQNGQLIQVEDNTVIITRRTLTECGIELSCIAAVMAHEATHSWIEHQAEKTGNSKNRANYIFPEEMVADQVAFRIDKAEELDDFSLQIHYDGEKVFCILTFGENACSNPRSLLAEGLGINLNDIYSQVYTVFWWRVKQ